MILPVIPDQEGISKFTLGPFYSFSTFSSTIRMNSCQARELFQVQSLFLYELVSPEKGGKKVRGLWQVTQKVLQAHMHRRNFH
jgi:hypothetical protein